MKKKNIVLLVCLAVVALLAGLTAALLGSNEEDAACRFYFTSDIGVKNGALIMDGESGSAAHIVPFSVSKAAKYRLHVAWETETEEPPGFLTVLLIKDSQGAVLSWLTGERVDAVMDPGKVEAGEYTAEYRYYTDEGELRKLLIGLGEDISEKERGSYEGFDSFGQEGTQMFQYTFELEEQSGMYRSEYTVGVFAGVLTGLLIAVILVVLSRKDRTVQCQYCC